MMTLEEENYTLQVQLAKLQVVLQQEHHARQLAEAKLKEHEQHSKAPAATQAHKDMHASLGSADAQGEIDGLRDCLKHASQEIHHRQTQLENAKQKISNLQEEKRRLQAQLASLASAAQQHRPQNHSVPQHHDQPHDGASQHYSEGQAHQGYPAGAQRRLYMSDGDIDVIHSSRLGHAERAERAQQHHDLNAEECDAQRPWQDEAHRQVGVPDQHRRMPAAPHQFDSMPATQQHSWPQPGNGHWEAPHHGDNYFHVDDSHDIQPVPGTGNSAEESLLAEFAAQGFDVSWAQQKRPAKHAQRQGRPIIIPSPSVARQQQPANEHQEAGKEWHDLPPSYAAADVWPGATSPAAGAKERPRQRQVSPQDLDLIYREIQLLQHKLEATEGRLSADRAAKRRTSRSAAASPARGHGSSPKPRKRSSSADRASVSHVQPGSSSRVSGKAGGARKAVRGTGARRRLQPVNEADENQCNMDLQPSPGSGSRPPWRFDMTDTEPRAPLGRPAEPAMPVPPSCAAQHAALQAANALQRVSGQPASPRCADPEIAACAEPRVMISYTAAAQMQPPTVASELIRSQQGGVVSSAEHACPSGGPVQSSTGCSPRFSALEAFTERDPNRSVSADASLVRMVIPSATPKRRHRGQGMKTHQQRAAALLSAGVSSTFAESCKTAAALDKLLRNMV